MVALLPGNSSETSRTGEYLLQIKGWGGESDQESARGEMQPHLHKDS